MGRDWTKALRSVDVSKYAEANALAADIKRVAREYEAQFDRQELAATAPAAFGDGPRADKRRAVASGDGLVAQTARVPDAVPRVRHRKEPARPQVPEEGAVGLESLPFECEGHSAGTGAGPQEAPPLMRGRLRGQAQAWEAWVTNPLVLSWVREGFPLRWKTGQPPPPYYGQNHASAQQHASFVDQAVAELLLSASIKRVDYQPRVVCPLGVVEQGPKCRLIWDGRRVNDYLHIPKFRYEDLRSAPAFLLPNDWVFTLDLKSGYHHLDVREDCWDYLGFSWRGQFYVFTQLPFGLASACWAFTKLTREVLRGWRRLGWRCSGYIDDQFHADQDKGRLVARREAILRQLKRLGFIVNKAKSMLGPPAQHFRYLGMLLDTQRGVFEVPDDKRSRLLDSIAAALSARRIPVRQIAGIKGQLLSMSWAFGPWSRLRTRALGQLVETRRSWSHHLPLSDAAREDLLFWQRCFDRFNGTRRLWRPSQVYSLIHCDAAGRSGVSLGGWGAWTVLSGQLAVARGDWDAATSRLGSTPQELSAVLQALRSFHRPAGLEGHTVRVITDNLNAANIINKGSAKASSCHEVAVELMWHCVDSGIDLQAEWRPRTANQVADYWSKLREPDDWGLAAAAFACLEREWGPFDIDLFASHKNNVVPTHYSKYFTPDTAGVDAFRFKWKGRCWAFPPFHLVLRTLQHAELCRARVCLVVPWWPTTPWWSRLTADGAYFLPCVQGVRVLGRASGLLQAGDSRPVPRGAANWCLLALLLDFKSASSQHLSIPANPLASPRSG